MIRTCPRKALISAYFPLIMTKFFLTLTERPTKPHITCTGEQGGISNLTVREGDDLECECSSEGLPSPKVIWEFSGGKSDDSVLKKEKISRNGSNIYTCIASNQYGVYNRSVLHLHVQCESFSNTINDLNIVLGQKKVLSGWWN